MARTIIDQGNEDWTVNKKRRRGVEEVDTEQGDACRKFGIILGGFRTEVEGLAELHLKYPWIQLTRRTNGAGNAILITKDDRSRELLTDIKTINGRDCSFRTLDNQTRKAYIMMGVPSCVTEELIRQDKEVLEASRMTKWNTDTQQAETTNMVKVVLVGKQHPARFTRGYGSFRMRPFVSRPLQCYNCQKFGHQARTCRSEVQTCKFCAGRHASTQCQDKETLKCANCGQGHATTSRLCPKKLAAEHKVKTSQTQSHKVTMTKQSTRNPAPIPLNNAWASLTIQEVVKRPFSGPSPTPQCAGKLSTGPTINQTTPGPQEQQLVGTDKNSSRCFFVDIGAHISVVPSSRLDRRSGPTVQHTR